MNQLYLYCPKCGRSNPYDGRMCSYCGTRLDNPTDQAKHNKAYPSSHKPSSPFPCSSPRCQAEVFFPSPLKDGTYNSPRTREARANKADVKKQPGVYCWKCGQYVTKPKKTESCWARLILFMLFVAAIVITLFLLFMFMS